MDWQPRVGEGMKGTDKDTQIVEFDLFFTAMFLMQGCLRSLTGSELQQARQDIRDVLQQITPLEKHPDMSAKKNLLLKVGQKHFEGTCKLLNFLIDIHVLT